LKVKANYTYTVMAPNGVSGLPELPTPHKISHNRANNGKLRADTQSLHDKRVGVSRQEPQNCRPTPPGTASVGKEVIKSTKKSKPRRQKIKLRCQGFEKKLREAAKAKTALIGNVKGLKKELHDAENAKAALIKTIEELEKGKWTLNQTLVEEMTTCQLKLVMLEKDHKQHVAALEAELEEIKNQNIMHKEGTIDLEASLNRIGTQYAELHIPVNEQDADKDQISFNNEMVVNENRRVDIVAKLSEIIRKSVGDFFEGVQHNGESSASEYMIVHDSGNNSSDFKDSVITLGDLLQSVTINDLIQSHVYTTHVNPSNKHKSKAHTNVPQKQYNSTTLSRRNAPLSGPNGSASNSGNDGNKKDNPNNPWTCVSSRS
jgi:hypothetical protein